MGSKWFIDCYIIFQFIVQSGGITYIYIQCDWTWNLDTHGHLHCIIFTRRSQSVVVLLRVETEPSVGGVARSNASAH